jgi:hypothetical protein
MGISATCSHQCGDWTTKDPLLNFVAWQNPAETGTVKMEMVATTKPHIWIWRRNRD